MRFDGKLVPVPPHLRDLLETLTDHDELRPGEAALLFGPAVSGLLFELDELLRFELGFGIAEDGTFRIERR